MAKLMTNSLVLKEFPHEFKTLKTNIQFTQLNQILGPFRDICYYLHEKKLYFLGDENILTRILSGLGFECSDVSQVTLHISKDWEIIRPIFYKCLRFYFYGRNFVHNPNNPKRRNQVFILEPEEFEGTRLIHELYNQSGERLLVYEGFRYWLEFMEEKLVLTLLPKVMPILPFKHKLTIKDITSNPSTFQEVGPSLMKQKNFSQEFRKIALKPNWKKRNVLEAIVKLLSDGKEEIVIPAGDIKRGLVLDSSFILIEEKEADFYGE